MKKNLFSAPPVHDYKLKVRNGNKKVQGKNIVHALDAASRFMDEHMTISCRAKDSNGQWYFNTITIGLGTLKSGDEINLGVKQLIVK